MSRSAPRGASTLRRSKVAHRSRLVPVGVVVIALVALLAGGAITKDHSSSARPPGADSLLSSVSLGHTTAAVWNCPGPLPVSGRSSSTVTVVNPSGRQALVSVLVAETATGPHWLTGKALPDQQRTLRVPPRSERQLPIAAQAPPAHTASVDASVSVTSAGAEVGVTEITSSPAGVLSSPCALGSASAGYTASGVTSGSSTVSVALFNPSSAPAVVNLTVGTDHGALQPEQYQGIELAPRSTSVVGLARYVPLRSHVAVEATSTVGRFVVGSVTEVSARFTTSVLGPGHSYTETGSELAVGIGCPLVKWQMALGTQNPNNTEAVRIFNPEKRRATVKVVTDEQGEDPASLSLSVAAGQTVTADAPAVAGKPDSGGVLSVTSTNGVPVVVEHESYRTLGEGKVRLSSSVPPASAWSRWLLAGMVQSASLNSDVLVTAAGPRPVTVRIQQVSEAGVLAGAQAPVVTLHLVHGQSEAVPASSLVTAGQSSTPFPVEAVADGPVLVSGGFVPANPAVQSSSEPGIPVLP